MGRTLLTNYAGETMNIHDSYVEKWEDDFVDRLQNNEEEFYYHFGYYINKQTKYLENKILVLQGEIDALKRTPEEKAEEEAFIKQRAIDLMNDYTKERKE